MPASVQASQPEPPTGAAEHQVGMLPAPRPVTEMLDSLQFYLPRNLYGPLEAVPSPKDLNAARDHLGALLGTLKTYLPWPVVSAPQPRGVPAGKMLRGVFLFGDVSGFTPLSEKLKTLGQEGAEIMTKLINALFTDLVTVLFDHGGTLLKFGGDAMLGLFPAESDEELLSGAVHAAQAALAMQQVLEKEQFAAIRVKDEIRSLKIKCGVSAGPYFAAHIGTRPSELNPNGTMAYVTTGTTVNLAEEAEGHANPGEVAMTRTVFELLGERAEIAPVNKEPDEDFRRLVHIEPLQGQSQRLEIAEPPEGEVLAQITYLTERLDRLTPYLADELVARIVTNPKNAKIPPDNRPVTVMFANYKGISKLIEKMGNTDPDAITYHLNNYFVHMASIIERYEGTLARMDQYAVGDRLVIFFGAPRAHEDDPVRAVSAALEMQEAVEQNFSALRTATGLHYFEQRIGINTGFLFAGNAGAPDLRQEYTLMGDDINMAARLMSKATWSHIFISRSTMKLVEAYFDLENMGELKVKGKEILIPTFKVLGKRGQVGRTRGFEEETPLIDRLEQMETLRKSGQTFLNSRRGQIVALVGNSGLGKSRLLRELRGWFLAQETTSAGANHKVFWVEARALSFSEQMSYWMAAEIMRSLLEIETGASQNQILRKLSDRCEAYFGDEAMQAIPYLAYMMGLDLGEEWAAVKNLDAKVRQKQIFRAAADFFASAAKDQAIVIAMDDLHWADEASLALLEHLLSVTDKEPLMFCLVFRARRDKMCWQLRDKAAADFPHRFVEVPLEPLERNLSAELLAQLLPGAQFDAETHSEILDKAAGNPFYLEEVVRSLRESGAVERLPEDQTRWRVTEKIAEIKVPSTLQAAIVARIDRLTEDVRMALQMAAVIGRQFRLTLFSSLAQTSDEISFWLSQLERSGLIRPAEISSDPLYAFPDTLVQEVAYDSLLMQNRQQFHRQVAEILETLLVRQAEESDQATEKLLQQNCELLAYHFRLSDQPEHAISHLKASAQKARAGYANETAIQHYQHLLQIQRKMGDKPGQAQTLYSVGVIAYEIGDYSRAREWLQESAQLLEEAGDLQNQAWSVLYLGMIDLKQANYDAAAAHHRHATRLAQERGDIGQEGIHLTNLGRVSMRMGQYELALEQFQKSLKMKRLKDDRLGEGFALFYQGLIYTYQGQLDRAEASLQDAFQVWSQIANNERVISYYHYGVGLLALQQAQFATAQEHLLKSLELCGKLVLKAETIEVLSALSQAKLGLSELQAAVDYSNQALELLAAQKDVEEIQEIYLNHYRALKAVNDTSAEDYLQTAYQTMMKRAERLQRSQDQQVYLESVKVNQAITALAQMGQA
ncbi:MAG: adenylate/guanylate cyclase domain-containing protein [Chloroflexota bacterium]